MDTSFIECLVMTLLSACVCICLPRFLTLIGSNTTSSPELSPVSLKPSRSDSSQPTDYPELTAVNN